MMKKRFWLLWKIWNNCTISSFCGRKPEHMLKGQPMFERFTQQFESYHVILEPDENRAEWWAGAPSVVHARDGAFYMAARMREGKSPRGRRGYEIRLLKSRDGIHFEQIHALHREEVNVPGFERPAIVQDPRTLEFKLYGCCASEEGWRIIKFDDATSPEQFKPSTAQTVIAPQIHHDGFARVSGYKDPFVAFLNHQWHLWAIGYDFVERAYHFISEDGVHWQPDTTQPWLDNQDWHNFYTRPACVLPLSIGYLVVYEGSHLSWRDPVYNIATGLGYSLDLAHVIDLTPDEPLLKSTTPGSYHTWRYSHWLHLDDQIYIYAEVARPNNSNEIRLFTLNSNILANLEK